MIADPNSQLTGFLQTVSVAVRQLKQQLQHDYDKAYPQLRDIIHLVVDEEASRAWSLSLFPHLLLPDLVEAHIEKLNLEPAPAAQQQGGRSPSFQRDKQLRTSLWPMRIEGIGCTNERPIMKFRSPTIETNTNEQPSDIAPAAVFFASSHAA